jgi:hypothetical protein
MSKGQKGMDLRGALRLLRDHMKAAIAPPAILQAEPPPPKVSAQAAANTDPISHVALGASPTPKAVVHSQRSQPVRQKIGKRGRGNLRPASAHTVAPLPSTPEDFGEFRSFKGAVVQPSTDPATFRGKQALDCAAAWKKDPLSGVIGA